MCACGEGQVRKFPALCHSLLLSSSCTLPPHNLRNALLGNAELPRQLHLQDTRSVAGTDESPVFA